MLDFSRIKTEWDLSPLLSDESPETLKKELEVLNKKSRDFITKWEPREDYLNNPAVLKEALLELEEFEAGGGAGGSISFYFGLRTAQRQNDPIVKAKNSKVEEQTLNLASDLQFFGLRLSRISQDKQNTFLTDPGLVSYKHLLEKLFNQGKYLLSEKEERILTLVSPVAYGNWVNMTSEFITTEEILSLNESGEMAPHNLSDLLNLLSSPNKEVRESAAAALDTIFEKHIKVGEAELNSVLTVKKIEDYLRNYPRPDSSRHVLDDVESQTVDTLIEVARANYSLVHKYYEFKAKLFKLPKIRYFERNVLYKGIEKKYSFNDASGIVYNTLTKLKEDYAKIFENYLYNGQIDVFTKKGKSSSQFCWNEAPKLPIYVMLNFGGKVQDISTIAHEMGHAINEELVKTAQNPLVSNVPLCLAETASTFFEDFSLDEIAKTLDTESKLALQIVRLDDAMNSVFRQIACYTFERDLHDFYRATGFLSCDKIGELFVKNMSEYCGDSVEMLPTSKNWWLHWPHIRSYFYVYTYAFGFLISQSFQKMVREKPESIELVHKFLSAGSSKAPKDILQDLSININDKDFWQKGIDRINDLFEETVELAKKGGHI